MGEETLKAIQEAIQKSFQEIVNTNLMENKMPNDFVTKDGYSIKKLEDTKELLHRYYSGKLSQRVAMIVNSAIQNIRKNPKARIIELFYGQRWHPEHIAREMKCSERMVNKHAEELLKRIAIAIFGIDAFYGL